MKRYRKWAAVLAALCMMGTAGCASQTSDVPSEQPGSESLTEPVSRETQEIIPESSREEAPSGSRPGGKETGSGHPHRRFDNERRKAKP